MLTQTPSKKLKLTVALFLVTIAAFSSGCQRQVPPTASKSVDVAESIGSLKAGGKYAVFLKQKGRKTLEIGFVDNKSVDISNPVEVVVFDISDYRRLGPYAFAIDGAPSKSHRGVTLTGNLSSGARDVDYLKADFTIMKNGRAVAEIVMDGYY